MAVSRRTFLTWSASVAAGVGLSACRGRVSQPGGAGPSTLAAAPTAAPTVPETAPQASVASVPESASSAVSGQQTMAAVDDRVLVVVQLSGGNDGLNTLVPIDGRYHDLRPTIGLKDESLLQIPGFDGYGLHPSLSPLQGLFDANQVAAVASLGYGNPGRSHFVALDNWWSATPGLASSTGWLGRYLDATGGTAADPLRAVALGSGVPALNGATSLPTVVLDPNSFAIKASASTRARLIDGWKLVGGPRSQAAADAVDVFAALKLQAAADGTDEKEGGDIARLLVSAAELIIAGKGAKIIHITAGGFDTHAGQLVTQAGLLDDLALGLKHFSDRMSAAGMADRALVMTTSEFGRRARENGSGGTDHGKAGVQFLVGPMVKGGLVGATNLGALDDGDVKPSIDVRALYATALDWLHGPTDEVLLGRFDNLAILR
jgi:uncharacterized protein (DUF1501 family)